MINLFYEKFKNKEYISNNLYQKVKKTYPNDLPTNFDIEAYNKEILNRDYMRYREYFANMYRGVDDPIELDEEQIKAILCDEDYSLILAGAGTGKTTTMVAKVKYLVDIKKIEPSKIVVMSYTKKATEELENRILLDFGIPAYVTTFHSLGLAYIREIFKDKKCYVVDNEQRNKIFIEYFKTQIFPYKQRVKELMNIFNSFTVNKPWLFSKYFQENESKYTSFDDFFEAYKKHKISEIKDLDTFVEEKIEKLINRDDNIYTIKGELVKSKGEAYIANFLYRNGIEYQYEKLYEEIMEDRRTYKPDFTIDVGGEEFYIEYFGLSTVGEPTRKELQRYEKIKKEKIKYHEEHHTKFIKIEPMNKEGIEGLLKEQLVKLGIAFKPKNSLEIYDRILSNNPTSQIYPFKDFLYELVDTLKSSNKRNSYRNLITNYIAKSPEELKGTMARQYFYVQEFFNFYQKQLFLNTESYGFDFSDMIYYANKYIGRLRGKDKFAYDYIIIDEYQDISSERYIFTKNLSTLNGSKVVAVGDDWQSIFAFSGSKIEYIYNFSKYFEGAKLLRISKAYRNSQELVNYSSNFIMKNPSQIEKKLISNKSIRNPIKFVPYRPGEEYSTLKKLILNIYRDNPKDKIMILARTNKMIFDCYKDDELKDGLGTKIEFVGYEDIDLEGMTLHKSKGLTCDQVIIIGLNKSFPSNAPYSFWIKYLLKEHLKEEGIDFAEERRLFYVGLTRTKNYVYLLTNTVEEQRSTFVNELLYSLKNNVKQ